MTRVPVTDEFELALELEEDGPSGGAEGPSADFDEAIGDAFPDLSGPQRSALWDAVVACIEARERGYGAD